MIIIVFGLPGSGKSYFASRLAELIGADYINSDRLRKEMFQKRTYSAQEKKAVYERMLEKMIAAKNLKKNLVLDATFHKNETRRFFADKIEKGGIIFIEVRADENIIRERVKNSRPDSEADYTVYKLIQQKWEPLEEPHLLLESTNDNIDDILQQATQYLHLKDDKGTD